MAHIVADRVKETTTTTGTGALTLAGAVTGFRAFSAVCATNDTVFYAIVGGAEWEVGLGTYSGTNTLTRTTVLASSNSGSAVNLSSGTKDVWITSPAAVFAPMMRMNQSGAAGYDLPGMTIISQVDVSRQNNVIYYEPMVIGPPGLTISEVAVYIGTAASAGNTIRMAIYRADADGQPGALVWGVTGISASTTGKKTSAPSVYLPPGNYLKAVWATATVGLYGWRATGTFIRSALAGYDCLITANKYRDAATNTTWADPGVAWDGADNDAIPMAHCVVVAI